MTGPADIVSTLKNTHPPEWVERVEMLDRERLGPRVLARELVAASSRARAMVLLGSTGFSARYADLVAAVAIARRCRPPHVVMTDATWEVGSQSLAGVAGRLVGGRRVDLSRVARAAVAALDGPHVTYCVLSSEEARTFPARWGVDPARVVFTPFCMTLWGDSLVPPRRLEPRVFAGGNPLRDYGSLIRAADGLERPVVIASSKLDLRDVATAPRNVQAGPLPHDRFVDELRRASVVVTPLKPGIERSAGQQTYLNAMALGKPVIVTDAPGVRDHIEHGSTGLIVPPGEPRALREALDYVLDPEHADDVAAMGRRASALVLERFTLDAYLRSLLAVVDRGTAASVTDPTQDDAYNRAEGVA